MFRDSVIYRRCIVPSTGFYEWGEDNNQLTLFDVPTKKGNKNKYLFTLPKQSVLYMAGFYKQFEGEDIPRFVILTTASNNSISDIHNRMPVILKPDKQMGWLENDADFEKVFYQLSIRLPAVKHLTGTDLWELRPTNDRIFFAHWKDNTFILLHHFVKKSQRTPLKEIEQAKRNMANFLKRSASK